MEPIDYTSAFNNLPSPQASFMHGVQNGVGLEQAQLLAQQQRAALAQQQQMKSEMAELAVNPTTDAIAKFTIKYPQLSEPYKRSYDMLAPGEQQSALQHATQVYAALDNGRPDIAKQVVMDKAAALRNSGNEAAAKAAEAQAKLIETDPTFAKITTGKMVASMAGGDKFISSMATMGQEQRAQEQAPADLAKKTADADAAVAGVGSAKAKAISDGVDAKYADQTALLKLEGIRTDNQYKRDQTKIAYLNAQISRETNTLKRQELSLQVQKATQERDDKVREKVASAESAASATDNMLNTVERVLKNPSLGSVLGSIQGRMPAVLSDEAADAIAQIETLGSQAFIAQIPSMKGTGSLSEKEGDKLQASLQNLSRVQSEEQFKANLAEVQRIAKKARDNISKRYGVPLGNPDTPAAAGARPPLSSFGG